jgi:hypothetical protein
MSILTSPLAQNLTVPGSILPESGEIAADSLGDSGLLNLKMNEMRAFGVG